VVPKRSVSHTKPLAASASAGRIPATTRKRGRVGEMRTGVPGQGGVSEYHFVSALRLRVALRRGALITAANWPLVAVEFVADSLYKAALGVPIVGGAVMVAALLGDDPGVLLSHGLRAAAGTLIASLTAAPVALAAFATALAVVAIGGAIIMFLVQAGSIAILVAGERRAPVELNAGSIRAEPMRLANQSHLELFLDGVGRFGRRMTVLGGWLVAAYVFVFASYFSGLLGTYRIAARAEWISAFPLAALLATSALVVIIAAVNLLYLLAQIIVVADDCTVRQAAKSLRRFLLHDARQVAGIFGMILSVVVLGTAASLVATAGLGLIAWVPFAGLMVLPLQAAAWLARGLVFQFIDLTALTAYLAQYRRFIQQE
jgi:hypothetical protein